MSIQSIRTLLNQAGLKFSRQRESILLLLRQSKSPQTAQEITDMLNAKQSGTAKPYWPSTIYRTLDLLLEAKLVTRMEIPSSEHGAYIMLVANADSHFAVCLGCHKITPLPACPIHEIKDELGETGFQVTNHRVEIYGLCSSCKSNANSADEVSATTHSDDAHSCDTHSCDAHSDLSKHTPPERKPSGTHNHINRPYNK